MGLNDYLGLPTMQSLAGASQQLGNDLRMQQGMQKMTELKPQTLDEAYDRLINHTKELADIKLRLEQLSDVLGGPQLVLRDPSQRDKPPQPEVVGKVIHFHQAISISESELGAIRMSLTRIEQLITGHKI